MPVAHGAHATKYYLVISALEKLLKCDRPNIDTFVITCGNNIIIIIMIIINIIYNNSHLVKIEEFSNAG